MGIPRNTICYFIVSITIITIYSMIQFYFGEASVINCSISIMFGVFWLSFEYSVMRFHDKFLQENLNKDLDSLDDLNDRTVVICMIAFGISLLGALFIFIKWTVLLNNFETIKECKTVKDTNASLIQGQNIRVIIMC